MSRTQPTIQEVLATDPTDADVRHITYAHIRLTEVQKSIDAIIGVWRMNGSICHEPLVASKIRELIQLRTTREQLENWILDAEMESSVYSLEKRTNQWHNSSKSK